MKKINVKNCFKAVAMVTILVIMTIIIPSSSISIDLGQESDKLNIQQDIVKNDCGCGDRSGDERSGYDCTSDVCIADIVFVKPDAFDPAEADSRVAAIKD